METWSGAIEINIEQFVKEDKLKPLQFWRKAKVTRTNIANKMHRYNH